MDKLEEITRLRKKAHCMQWHIDQAASAGATQAEILEAIEVGIEMGAGRVTVSARFALEAMERAFAPDKPPRGPAAAPGL